VPAAAVDPLGASRRGQGDALLVTGDVGERDSFAPLLGRLATADPTTLGV
jgi:hypothetical protein